MKYPRMTSLFGLLFLPIFSATAGFLTAQSFPKTTNDLSFVARMGMLAEDYAGFERKYDSAGRCISGCSYHTMTIEDAHTAAQRTGVLANLVTPADEIYTPGRPPHSEPVAPTPSSEIDITMAPTVPSATPPTPVLPPSPPTPPVTPPTPPVTPPPAQYACAVHSSIVRPTNKTPSQAPLDINLVITSDFGPRRAPTAGASTIHNALDFSAATGTPVYSPADGTVERYVGGGCGLGLRIRHANGFETMYCHLSQRTVAPGDKVGSGCLIGRVGNTGISTGPHLHYAILLNGEPVDPLYEHNRLGREYRLNNPSSWHTGLTLPGRI